MPIGCLVKLKAHSDELLLLRWTVVQKLEKLEKDLFFALNPSAALGRVKCMSFEWALRNHLIF